MKLTEKNYYSKSANREFFSVSQLKDFLKCPAMAMAKLRGEYVQAESRSLLLGSYFDECLTGTEKSLRRFIEENYSELYKKNGEPYADIAQALETVKRVEQQPLMMHYLNGEHQVIMTGNIAGVPVKGKFDSYKPRKFLVDLKYLKSLRSPNLFENVLDYWKYPMQMAVYQELAFQNTGERLPCYIVAATKENPAHITVCEIDQYTLDKELEKVKTNLPYFQKVKDGEIEPERCESYDCDFCAESKVLTEPIPYELLGMSTAQLKAMRGEI